MNNETYITNSAKQTQKIAEKLAKKIVSPIAIFNKGERRGSSLVLALEGELGSGKTTFVQGIARGLGIKENITSPTFVVLKKFQVSSFKFHFFYHIDCYRLEKPEDLLDLGIEKILLDRHNIVVIEWAEKIQKILPSFIIKIKFEFVDDAKRKITMNYDL
jgi:tRNA threonylcarbamoyladenosine biosynthesis protein TsaE